MITIKEVLDENAKSGVGAKGEWSMSKVRLSNGKEVNMFNPVEVSDEVEEYDNKGYKNWRKVRKQAGGNADYDKALNMIMEQNKQTLQAIKALDTRLADFTAKNAPNGSTDVVHDVDDETISLDEVGF